MYCPNCKQHFDSGKFCPDCEGPNGEAIRLVNDPAPAAGVSLGDAAAISGGLHVSDSHAVTNIDNSVHNTTNNTSTVNNITNVAAQKTELELLREHKTLFLNACKRAFEDNVLDPAEEVELEELRIKLNLDGKTASSIIESVRVMSEKNTRKTSLNPYAMTKLKILSDNLHSNDVKALINQIDNFASLVRIYDHDELNLKYYLVLAALKSEKCIELKENSQIDNYWNSFWSYLAYIKTGRLKQAENVLVSLEHFTSYPEDNINLLAVAGSLMTDDKELAREYMAQIIGDYTPSLQRFADSIYLLLEPEIAKEMGADENSCAFYLVNFFGQKDTKAEADNLRRAEELVKMGDEFDWNNNEEKAAECYEKAAELGLAKAIYKLGLCYYSGSGVNQDFSKAMRLFDEAAEKDDLHALDRLAFIYRNGDADEGLEKDLDKAADYMYKIYDLTDEETILNELENDFYFNMLDLGNELLNFKNSSKAIKLFNVVAGLQDLNWEGLEEAKEIAKNLIEAEELYKVGYEYIDKFLDIPTKDDYVKAVEYFEKAANLGHVWAQYELGQCYKKGNGVEQDFEQALYWFNMAADQDNLKSKNALMSIYSANTLGDGILDDEPNKYKDLMKAAELAFWIMEHADDKLISKEIDDSWYYSVYILGEQLWNLETDDLSLYKLRAVALLKRVARIADDSNVFSNNNDAKKEAQVFLKNHGDEGEEELGGGEEERIRKAKEEEEAKRKAEEEEEEAKRKAKEAEEADRKTKEEAIRKAKEAEEAKRRAEEEARRNAEEAEKKRLEAERKAKEEAIRKAKEAEEAKRRAEEAKRRAEEEARRRAEEAKRRAEEEARRKAEEAERRAEALMLKLQEEKKEKNRKTILFALCVILSIIPLVWVSIGGWESMGWGSILAGAIVAAGVGVGTLGIVVGDEKQWKAILFRSVFALIALGLMIKSIISGTFGFSSICLSMFAGLFCTGLVMAFSKPSFFKE